MNTLNEHKSIIPYTLHDDGVFPNNSKLPVIFYKDAVILSPEASDKPFLNLFHDHNWRNEWTNGIYNYHHYHSISHEVLGIVSGRASLQLGGDFGVTIEIKKGDVIVIPAGVAHKNLFSSADFKCVGAYPDGMEYDIRTGKPNERPTTDQNIANVPLPKSDPVYGEDGPLLKYWKNRIAEPLS
jgi:uncharacterized protein YjlB